MLKINVCKYKQGLPSNLSHRRNFFLILSENQNFQWYLVYVEKFKWFSDQYTYVNYLLETIQPRFSVYRTNIRLLVGLLRYIGQQDQFLNTHVLIYVGQKNSQFRVFQTVLHLKCSIPTFIYQNGNIRVSIKQQHIQLIFKAT